MPTFTDTELQKKFCEGFTFFPFKSLEQHDTLIYKCYSRKENLKQLLAWHNSEHDTSHYRIKLAKKLKHTDLPAAARLLQALQEMDDWCKARVFAAKLRTSGKTFSAGIDKYRQMLEPYHLDVLRPFAMKLADNYQGISIEHLGKMKGAMETFLRSADELYENLKESADGKQNLFQQSASDGDRENFLKLVSLMQSFSAHQSRSIQLLDSWKTRQAVHDNYIALN